MSAWASQSELANNTGALSPPAYRQSYTPYQMAGRMLSSGFRVASTPMAAPLLRRNAAAVRCAPRAAPVIPRFASGRTLATASTGVNAAEEKEQAGPSSSLIEARTRDVSATESHAVALQQTGWRQTMLKLSGCARHRPATRAIHPTLTPLRSLAPSIEPEPLVLTRATTDACAGTTPRAACRCGCLGYCESRSSCAALPAVRLIAYLPARSRAVC